MIPKHSHSFPWAFILPTILLLLTLAVLLCIYPKADLHLLLCDHHTALCDTLFPCYSQVIRWLPYVTLVGLLFYKAGWAVFLAADMVLTNMFVLPLKEFFCAPRPITWFAQHYPDITLPLTPGVTMNEWYSFPSGHSCDFFLFFFVSAILLHTELYPEAAGRGKGRIVLLNILEFLFFVFASIGAYTRIYLSQHFAFDVFVGIAIAFLCTLVLYFWALPRLQSTHFWSFRLQKTKKCI